MSAPKPITPPASDIQITSLAELVEALPDSQIMLRSDIERYIRPVSFKPGKAELRVTDPRFNNLIGKIVQALSDLTGELWIVSPSDQEGEPTLAEQKRAARKSRDAAERAHPAFAHPLLANGTLLGIHDVTTNIIQGNFVPENLSDDIADED
ncbi:hypothetical protein AB8615_10275 [Litorimonas sp. RW-G-Af-16]